jgi:1,4-dihydroxy-2-naphthoate octaprenyltransferase
MSMADARRSTFSIWLQALRPFSYTASIIPVCCGAALAVGCPDVKWTLLPLVILASLSIHAATNLVNDYFDFVKGVDRPDTLGGSRVLADGLLRPTPVLVAGLFCFALTAALGLIFVWLRGWPILLLGAVGMAGGFFYTALPGYKYVGLGDLMVFWLMGPLMVIGSFFVLTGTYTRSVLLISLPIGCLVAAILSANNLRDIAHDTRAGIKTTAGLLGRRWARREYAALILSAYVIVIALLLIRMLPLWSLLTLLTAPLAFANIRSALTSMPENPQPIASLDQRTAGLHLAFGLLLIASILLGKFV